MVRFLRFGLISAVLVIGVGCSGEGPDTGVADTGPGDSAADTGAACEADWSCLGSVTIPALAAATARLSVNVNDYAARPAEVDFAACLRDDVDCTAPVAMATTDDLGTFEVTLPTDPDPFWGFVTAPDFVPPHEFFGSMPFSEDTNTFANLINTGVINGAAAGIGETPDLTSNGLVAAYAFDCNSALACGVRFELESGSGTPFYNQGTGIPTFSTTQTETAEGGGWGVLDVPPGDHRVSAFLAADDTPIAVVDFTVKAGVVSQLYMNPTPDGAAYTP